MFYTDEDYVKFTWKENNSVEISHYFNKREKREFYTTKTSGYKGSYKNLTVRNYMRQLNDFYARVKDRLYDNRRCVFITLTTKKVIAPKLLVKKFGSFIKSLRNNYGKIEYARVVEYNEKDKRCHIHCILQFDERPIISESIFKKYWDLGNCTISNLTKDCVDISTMPLIDNVVNVLQYMSKYSKKDIFHYHKTLDDIKLRCESRFTLFPSNFRVCAISRSFGTIVQLDSITYNIPVSKAEKLLQKWKDNSKPRRKHQNVNKSLRIQGHYHNNVLYFDKVDLRNITKEELETDIS